MRMAKFMIGGVVGLFTVVGLSIALVKFIQWFVDFLILRYGYDTTNVITISMLIASLGSSIGFWVYTIDDIFRMELRLSEKKKVQ